jgi:hypothetical protein
MVSSEHIGQDLEYHIINEIKSISIETIYQNQTMIKKIFGLESRIENLENEKNKREKYRITSEILTPLVRQIRSSMIDERIPDSYYSKIIINSLLLRAHSDNITGPQRRPVNGGKP